MLMEYIGMINPRNIIKYIAIGCFAMSGSILVDIVRGDQILKPEYRYDEELTNEEE